MSRADYVRHGDHVADTPECWDKCGDPADLCFVLTEDNGSFCSRTLPCPEHNDGRDDGAR